MAISKKKYDFVIIGSGFGGSVSALRLAEKGYSVLVIEKGKRFESDDFPKTNWNLKKWLWLPSFRLYGIQKLTIFKHASILSGVGVGGGSLVYANTLPKPKSAFFNKGSWANLQNWETVLEPHYKTAWKMLGADTNPFLGDGDLIFQDLANKINKPKSFEPTKVSVYFGKPSKTVNDPYFDGKGPTRTGCKFCGSCMTGCRHNAKNTLDKNYLYLAEILGVEVLPKHEVVDVIPNNDNTNYQVIFKQSTRYFGKKSTIAASNIVFAGGVLGTVPLLLKLKKSRLTNLSNRVGEMVRTNNEALILNTSLDKTKDFSEGIAIGSILELDENSCLETARYGKGSGFWRLLILPLITEKNFFKRILKLLIIPFTSPIKWIKVWFIKDFAKSTSVLLFMQHLDSTLKIKRGLLSSYTTIDKGNPPSAFIKEAHEIAKIHAKMTNSKSQVMSLETITGIPSTAHILGGAVMGKNKDEGVIDTENRIFGYPNLYVCDGSMISANIGVNPSLTITAITEHAMSLIPIKQ
ncbi:MAG: GMC oxidoreductase [Flavobacteriaceae bacterium]|jgi:cholesterol oxidase|nr:GMC oxidoreductase [Flavobacteriaceae bacterium]